jgi:hypothetical protein
VLKWQLKSIAIIIMANASLEIAKSNKSVLNGCLLWHPLNYNKKLWQRKKHLKFPMF